MKEIHDKVLYVFTQDLRVNDNAALLRASSAGISMGCVYCLDDKAMQQSQYNCIRVGSKRRRFLIESLTQLDGDLHKLGQHLHILSGPALQALADTIVDYGATLVVYSRQPGYDENLFWQKLQDALPHIQLLTLDTHTLFERDQVPAKEDFTATFSQFRRLAEKIAPPTAKERPKSLAPSFFAKSAFKLSAPSQKVASLQFRGGEERGLAHLQQYFSSQAPQHYKATRNALNGWAHSTKFSLWLALGCLSPRTIRDALQIYENEHGTNASTEWIYVELLWREFFFWYAFYHGKKAFTFSGIKSKKPLTSFYPHRFKHWCEGTTPWPLVNACMRELSATGYMSNRGRQIVASALVNELAVDWRYGAAWFEQELLDYEVGSNWGNWQYIAGVGADARGGRHFNIEKQTSQYDPDGSFIRQWGGKANPNSLHQVDAADWPLD